MRLSINYVRPPRHPQETFMLFWTLAFLDCMVLDQVRVAIGEVESTHLVPARMQKEQGCAKVHLEQDTNNRIQTTGYFHRDDKRAANARNWYALQVLSGIVQTEFKKQRSVRKEAFFNQELMF